MTQDNLYTCVGISELYLTIYFHLFYVHVFGINSGIVTVR